MGRRKRTEKRAARKSKRAKKKRERAKKLGNSKRAKKLTKKADKLDKRSKELKDAVKNQIITGLIASVSSVNSLGNTTITASWNYTSLELQNYSNIRLSMAPTSPLRSTNWNQLSPDLATSTTSFTFNLGKNLRYIVKVFGVNWAGTKLLDSVSIPKYKN